MMRTLLIVIVLAALGWSGYWWAGASAQKAGLDAWIADRRAQGWVADAGEISVSGFPNRFDTTITDLSLADPVSAWSWDAPDFRIFALSYKPNHIIVDWPRTQTVSSPVERIGIASDTMRGSVRFQPDTQLALEEARVELAGVEAESTLGWSAALKSGQLAIRRSPPGNAPEHSYDVSLTANDLTLPLPFKDAVDPAGLLPASLGYAEIRVTPVYDAIWNRSAVEGPLPQLRAINIQSISATWGRLEVGLKGRLDADAEGYAEGEINVIARNWRDMLELGVSAGFVPEGMANNIETGLSFLAQGLGDTNMLDVKLGFRNGRVHLGPIPVGRAPRLR